MLLDDPAQNQRDTQAMAKAVSDAEGASDAPEWALPLLAAGLGMMASNNPSGMAAVGEGGLAGLKTWLGAKQTADRRRERKEDVQYRQARLKQDDAQAQEANATRVRLAKIEAETMGPYRDAQTRAANALANYREAGGAPSASNTFSYEDAIKEANRTANAAAKDITGEFSMQKFTQVRDQALASMGFTPGGQRLGGGTSAMRADPLRLR